MPAVGEGASVAETGEVERPDVHDRLEPVEFVVGRLDMSAVGADGSVDPLLVRPAWVPRTRAPDQVSEVGEARSAPGRFPVDRDWPLFAQDGVIGGVEEVSVEQAFRKAVTVVGRAHLVAELLESLALGGRDLGVDGVDRPHQVRPGDVVIGVLSMFHIFGMQVSMNLTLRAGATLVTIPRFSLDSFLGVVEAYRVTRAELVPPIVLALAKRPEVDRYDLSSLRVIASGAAPLGLDLARAYAERLGCRVKQGYGMTELGGASHLAPDTGPDDPESIGSAIPGVQCRVADIATGADAAPGHRGELLVRTPAAMLGYLNNPQATAATIDAGRWVHTGDIATVDERGWFRVVDRLKELIKYRGLPGGPRRAGRHPAHPPLRRRLCRHRHQPPRSVHTATPGVATIADGPGPAHRGPAHAVGDAVHG